MKKITISYSGCYAENKPLLQACDESELQISFHELKSWIKSGKILFHLFRYREAHLNAYDLRLISKPFLLSCILKVLSREKSLIFDKEGNRKEVTLSWIGQLFVTMIRDSFKKRAFIKKIRKEVQELSNRCHKSEMTITSQPVYLRTDFCFGLESGGSVGHIAGVLNHLHLFSPPPYFFNFGSHPDCRSSLGVPCHFSRCEFLGF